MCELGQPRIEGLSQLPGGAKAGWLGGVNAKAQRRCKRHGACPKQTAARGTGTAVAEGSVRRTSARSNSKTDLMTEIYIRTPTTHRADFYDRQAGACGRRPHASGASCRAKSRYARLRPKGEASRCLSSMQGRTLTMLAFNERANPRYSRVQPKSHSSLSLSIM